MNAEVIVGPFGQGKHVWDGEVAGAPEVHDAFDRRVGRMMRRHAEHLVKPLALLVDEALMSAADPSPASQIGVGLVLVVVGAGLVARHAPGAPRARRYLQGALASALPGWQHQEER